MFPPEAVNTVALPKQIVGDDGVIVKLGPAVGVKVILAVAVHPFASVPVTVYVFVSLTFTEGLIIELGVFPDEAVQVYDTNPAGAAVKVMVEPAQKFVELAVILITGGVFTETVIGVTLDTQPVVELVTVKLKS